MSKDKTEPLDPPLATNGKPDQVFVIQQQRGVSRWMDEAADVMQADAWVDIATVHDPGEHAAPHRLEAGAGGREGPDGRYGAEAAGAGREVGRGPRAGGASAPDGVADLMAAETISCRAKLDGGCYDGSPMSRQMPGEEDPAMREDGTYDGQSIVCDPCYLNLCPLTRSGAALHDEIPAAISLYRQNVAFLSEQDDPASFVEQAKAAMEKAGVGSPYWASARAMMGLAQAEVDRRAAAA